MFPVPCYGGPMKNFRRVTLTDVAARSGVSAATASMILAERPDVSFAPETVLKVREAAESLGYRGVRRHRPSRILAEQSVAIICHHLPQRGQPVLFHASAVHSGCRRPT